jgi:hypothetical protein
MVYSTTTSLVLDAKPECHYLVKLLFFPCWLVMERVILFEGWFFEEINWKQRIKINPNNLGNIITLHYI